MRWISYIGGSIPSFRLLIVFHLLSRIHGAGSLAYQCSEFETRKLSLRNEILEGWLEGFR